MLRFQYESHIYMRVCTYIIFIKRNNTCPYVDCVVKYISLTRIWTAPLARTYGVIIGILITCICICVICVIYVGRFAYNIAKMNQLVPYTRYINVDIYALTITVTWGNILGFVVIMIKVMVMKIIAMW